MCSVALHTQCRDRPKRFVEINLRPSHLSEFAHPLARQYQKPDQHSKWITGDAGRIPYRAQLIIGQNTFPGLTLADQITGPEIGHGRGDKAEFMRADGPTEQVT